MKASLFAVATLLVASAAHVQAQKIVPNEGRCVGEPHYSQFTGNDEYHNGCGYPVWVTVIYTNNHNGAFGMHLESGGNGSTGHSRQDVIRLGEPHIYVCPSGGKPIDEDGKVLYARPATGEYRCSL